MIDIEKLADEKYPYKLSSGARRAGFVEGFKAHQELVKDKLFTRKQLIDFTEKCMIIANETDNIGRLQRFISKQAESLLPQTEWNVKINEDGKLELL